MNESTVIASCTFEGLDELIDSLERLRDLSDNQIGVEGAFALTGWCVLWDHGDDIHVIEITDKTTDAIEAKDLDA